MSTKCKQMAAPSVRQGQEPPKEIRRLGHLLVGLLISACETSAEELPRDASGTFDSATDRDGGVSADGSSGLEDGGVERCQAPTELQLNRILVVYALAGDEEIGVSGATVQATIGGTELSGVTDRNGCVRFDLSAPAERSAQILVVAAGFAPAIRVGSPLAENRFLLTERVGALPPQATGRYEGLMTGLELIGTPTSATSSWIGRVVPLVSDVFTNGSPARRMLPDGRRTGEILVGATLNRPDFEMEVYADAALGLGAYAGATNANGTWMPQVLGWRHGAVAAGAVSSGFDVELRIRATVTGAVTIPAGFPTPLRGVFNTLRLPEGGWFMWPSPPTGIELPPLEGPLAGGEYGYLVYGGPDSALSVSWVHGTQTDQVLPEHLRPRTPSFEADVLRLEPLRPWPEPVICRVYAYRPGERLFELVDFSSAAEFNLPPSIASELSGAIDVTVNCDRLSGWSVDQHGAAWSDFTEAYSSRSVQLQLP